MKQVSPTCCEVNKVWCIVTACQSCFCSC